MMPSPRTYATAGAFRRALEERLKRASLTDQIDLNRLRRQVSFDRLLARLFREEPAPWVLKGGYALELRFKAARSTVDIDLTLQQVGAATSAGGDTNQVVRGMLQSVADIPLGDWFEYVIGPPVIDLTAAPYGGARYPVEARMDERIFARFHLDAGIGDVVMQPLETIICRDWLGFAGIESARVRMIAREQQFAEKIHAYTLPRNAANSRVKDLVDLALLIRSGGLDKQRILDALRLTFERRGTHDLPGDLVPPPADWQIPFQALVEECGLPTDIAAVFAGVQEYLQECETLLKEILEQSLSSTEPTSVHQIAVRLEHPNSGYIQQKFPELCAAIGKKIVQAKQDRLQSMRRTLRNALHEHPPPTLTDLSHRVGYSHSAILRRHEPALCDQLMAQYRFYITKRRSGLEKEAMAALRETPAPSLRAVCRRLDITVPFMNKHFPAEARMIIEQHRRFVSAETAHRRERLFHDIHAVAAELQSRGIYPSVERVAERIPERSRCDWKTISSAVREARNVLATGPHNCTVDSLRQGWSMNSLFISRNS